MARVREGGRGGGGAGGGGGERAGGVGGGGGERGKGWLRSAGGGGGTGTGGAIAILSLFLCLCEVRKEAETSRVSNAGETRGSARERWRMESDGDRCEKHGETARERQLERDS